MSEEEYNKLVNQLFQSEEWEKRAEAARKIGSLGEGRATNLLVRALNKEEDPSVLNRIIEALGRIRNAKATMPIIDFLKKELDKPIPDNTRLFIIVESLMKIGDKRALSQLGLLYDSCEADIKALTEEALQCIDPQWKTHLKEA
ncbi:MAG: HEAT repeat domain-containing protein [Candidatus Lokiarchaeota archaeon]|nr:HEAT repeat domain-containing protein [Candidatus Lokiarchaeota archaeon]